MTDSVNNPDIKEIVSHFDFSGTLSSAEPTGSGLINTTYRLVFSDGNVEKKYILQQINTSVFKKPDELMSNIMSVTGYLRNKISLKGGNPQRETLTFLYTREGSAYYRDSEDRCWRAYNYIDNCYTCDRVDSTVKARRSGSAFGEFQCLLDGYPMDGLFETIPDFHNTPVRYRDFLQAVSDNLSGRLGNAGPEVEFAVSRKKDASVLTDMLADRQLPLRVTHNDTKINNVLFDKITNEAFCVIDLDTIMPGLSLYDFGDSIRSGAVKSDENERDLSKYGLDIELFESYTDGFLSKAAEFLTGNEVKMLVFSAKLLALECGVRFLTDYLNGDTYFKTDYPDHNLIRCRTQFKLVKEIEDNMDELEKITAELYRRYSCIE